jgi:hypothetical protein
VTTHCFIPVLGKRIRVTALDACGLPNALGTADSVVVTDGFITLALSSEVEDGTEIITKKASGALCVNEKLADSFKRFTIEMEFCGVNPGLLSLTTNAEPYEDYLGDLAGFTVPEGEMTKKFALELWTGMSGQACAPGAEEASGYVLLPFVQAGVLGDISVDGENAVTFSLTGAYTKGGNAWGIGPENVLFNASDVAAKLPLALDPLDHLLLIDTGLAPPPSTCELLPMGPIPAGTLTTVAPATGPAAGGTALTLTGTNFMAVTGVLVGGAAATSVILVSPTSITCNAPAHAAGGPFDVVVERAAGGNITKTAAYTYT